MIATPETGCVGWMAHKMAGGTLGPGTCLPDTSPCPQSSSVNDHQSLQWLPSGGDFFLVEVTGEGDLYGSLIILWGAIHCFCCAVQRVLCRQVEGCDRPGSFHLDSTASQVQLLDPTNFPPIFGCDEAHLHVPQQPSLMRDHDYLRRLSCSPVPTTA